MANMQWFDKEIPYIIDNGDGHVRYSNEIQLCFGRTDAIKDTTITYPMPFRDANSYSVAGV